MKCLMGFLVLCVLVPLGFSDEPPLFDALMIPSIADRNLDFWFYTPPDTGPNIPKVSRVYRNQLWMLLMFSRVEPAGSQKEVDITFDLKIISSNQKVSLEQKGISFYRGKVPDGTLLIPQEVLEIAFDEAESFGSYQIEAIFSENVSRRTCQATTEIELIPYTAPEPFVSDEAYSDWIMQYYQHPDPIRSFAGILYSVKTDPEWIQDNLMTLAFHRRIFLDNPFLWDYYGQLYQTVPREDKKKMLLVAAVTDCKEKQAFEAAIKGDLKSFYQQAKETAIPDTSQSITSAVQLDVLWAEFLASGTYEPVRRITSALALKKYEEVLEKIKKKERTEFADDLEHQVMLGAVFGAARWSLLSNCMQFDRVLQYCRTIYERESLEPEVKESLGTILAVVYQEKQEQEREQAEQGSNGNHKTKQAQ